MIRHSILLLAAFALVSCKGTLEDGISGNYRFETRSSETDPALRGGGGTPDMVLTFNADKTIFPLDKLKESVIVRTPLAGDLRSSGDEPAESRCVPD